MKTLDEFLTIVITIGLILICLLGLWASNVPTNCDEKIITIDRTFQLERNRLLIGTYVVYYATDTEGTSYTVEDDRLFVNLSPGKRYSAMICTFVSKKEIHAASILP
jgi:hypothetical protein